MQISITMWEYTEYMNQNLQILLFPPNPDYEVAMAEASMFHPLLLRRAPEKYLRQNDNISGLQSQNMV